MNVKRPTLMSVMKTQNVPTLLVHITVVVWMDILEMEHTVKVMTDSLC